MDRDDKRDRLLTPAEVAGIFRVDPKTVAGWAKAGKLTYVMTLGGRRRYLESEVLSLVQEDRPAPRLPGQEQRGDPPDRPG